MNQRELTAWQNALDQYPKLRPYQADLRRLAVKDVPGYVNPKQLEDKESGIPWTMMLGHMIHHENTNIPKEFAFEVPLFIIEYEKQFRLGWDYSHSFDSVNGIVLLKKITEFAENRYLQAQYWFTIENKAITIQLDDYKDHIYLYFKSVLDIPDGLNDKEYGRRYKKYYDAWKKADGKEGVGTRISEYWEKCWCRGNIENEIERCCRVANAIQKFAVDASRVKETLRWQDEIANLLFPGE